MSATPNAPSQLRTIVPIVVALLASRGLDGWGIIDSTTWSLIVGGVVGWLYYFVLRVAERLSSTKWGWLLGYPAAPTYEEYEGRHEAA